MAFVKGKCVYQGNTGKKLSCHKSTKDANTRVAELHKEHSPSSKNRGASAKKRQG